MSAGVPDGVEPAGLEVPDADAAEQARVAVQDADDDASPIEEPYDVPYDADPADAVEQRLEVRVDDDERR